MGLVDAEAPRRLPLRRRECGPAALAGRHRGSTEPVGVEFAALGAGAAGFIPALGLHGTHGEHRAVAVHTAGDARQCSTGFKVLRVGGPVDLIPALLSDQSVAGVGFEDDVVMEALCRRPLHVLGRLQDLLAFHGAGPRLRRGGGRQGPAREEAAYDLLAAAVLRGPHLEAAHLVGPEPHAVLGAPVERGHRGPQGALEPGRLGAVVGAGVQPAAPGPPSPRDAGCGGPRRRGQVARAAGVEVAAGEEVPLPAVADGALLPDQAPQLLRVGLAGVRGHEEAALLAPVRELRVEDLPEEQPVAFRQELAVLLEALPEGLAEGGEVTGRPQATPPAARGRILVLSHLGGRGQVERVQAEVHAPRLVRPAEGYDPFRGRLPREGALGDRDGDPADDRARGHGAELELVQPELDAPVDAPRAHGAGVAGVEDLAALDVDLRDGAPVPHLRDLHATRRVGLSCQIEPLVLQFDVRVDREFGERRCLRQLA
mmetsp:Transcript_69319/g.195475  ORF Transcript_69319/g.195475 Transcript_69319/m.195475 type:complete len:485 (-) Transcript_69319:173-1627(-)